MKEAEIYRKAAALIRKVGWFGINKSDGDDNVCLAIAVGNFVTINYFRYNPTINKLHEVVGNNMVAFNDSSSKEDVLAALEIAEHLATPTPK